MRAHTTVVPDDSLPDVTGHYPNATRQREIAPLKVLFDMVDTVGRDAPSEGTRTMGPMPEPVSDPVGSEGRCPWAQSTPDYLRYHDEEWGRPVHGEAALFERVTLEAFQSGLSWLTILRRREGFRTAFSGFDADVVAGFGEADRARLLADPGIIRNRAKVDAAITNARAVVALRERGGLDAVLWSFAPERHGRPATVADVPAQTPGSVALARALRAAGFTFVGPTTMYAAMQACGLVNDHIVGCPAGDRPSPWSAPVSGPS
jgi:DNA-3-methyladenine glycosylase I